MNYNKRIDEIREELKNMNIEEVADHLRKSVGDLEIEINVVNKKNSGIFIKED